MVMCSDDCTPCCDFCIHAIHEEFIIGGTEYLGGPTGCSLHEDKKHQEIAEGCSYCDDFYCFRVDKENNNG